MRVLARPKPGRGGSAPRLGGTPGSARHPRCRRRRGGRGHASVPSTSSPPMWMRGWVAFRRQPSCRRTVDSRPSARSPAGSRPRGAHRPGRRPPTALGPAPSSTRVTPRCTSAPTDPAWARRASEIPGWLTPREPGTPGTRPAKLRVLAIATSIGTVSSKFAHVGQHVGVRHRHHDVGQAELGGLLQAPRGQVLAADTVHERRVPLHHQHLVARPRQDGRRRGAGDTAAHDDGVNPSHLGSVGEGGGRQVDPLGHRSQLLQLGHDLLGEQPHAALGLLRAACRRSGTRR